jgi:hypothetical protein
MRHLVAPDQACARYACRERLGGGADRLTPIGKVACRSDSQTASRTTARFNRYAGKIPTFDSVGPVGRRSDFVDWLALRSSAGITAVCQTPRPSSEFLCLEKPARPGTVTTSVYFGISSR